VKAIRLADSAPSPALIEEDVPQPQRGRGELLIRVYAAELSWYPTTHSETGERRTRAIPGHEFSGVIAAIGQGAEGLDTCQVLRRKGRRIRALRNRYPMRRAAVDSSTR